jgi:uncharacterized protein (TIGR02996 family)
VAKLRSRSLGARLGEGIDTHDGRLVYADWLEEQGDPLAATVRLLDEYIAFVEQILDEHFVFMELQKDYDPDDVIDHISVTAGRTYWRVVKYFSASSRHPNPAVFGFVRKADGAILGAQSWKRPWPNDSPAGYLNNRQSWINRLTILGIWRPAASGEPY